MRSKRRVYIIRDGDLYKIGSSKDPESRLPLVALSDAAEMVHHFPSARAYLVENALHRRFSNVRAEDAPGREWFRLNDEDVSLLCALTAADDVSDLPDSLQTGERPRPEPKGRQINVRLQWEVFDTISAICKDTGLDVSSVIRMILTQKSGEYIRQIQRRRAEED